MLDLYVLNEIKYHPMDYYRMMLSNTRRCFVRTIYRSYMQIFAIKLNWIYKKEVRCCYSI